MKFTLVEDLNKVFSLYCTYNGEEILKNSENLFKIASLPIIFDTEQDAIIYIDNNLRILREAKKKKKQHAMGWFTSFMPDPEKSMEEFNKNMEYNTEVDNSSSESSASADTSASI